MKKCSPSLPIKEMQIKTMLKFHFIPVRITIIKNNNNKCWQNWGQGGRNPHTLLVGVKVSTTTMENSISFL
jgi:hypothetical protein